MQKKKQKILFFFFSFKNNYKKKINEKPTEVKLLFEVPKRLKKQIQKQLFTFSTKKKNKKK